MRKFIYISLAVSVVFLGSCGDKIEGSGNIITNDYNISSAKEIEIYADFDFIVQQDSISTVAITTDDNIIPHIQVTEFGGVLQITYNTKDKRLRPTHPIQVLILTKDLDYLSADYDSYVEMNNIKTDFLHLQNLDADIIADNFDVNYLDLDNYEGGTLSLYGLENDTVLAYNSGTGIIELSGYGYYGRYTNNGLGNIYADFMNLYICDATLESSSDDPFRCDISVLVDRQGWLSADFKNGSSGYVYSATEPTRWSEKGSGAGQIEFGIPEGFKDTNPLYYDLKKKGDRKIID